MPKGEETELSRRKFLAASAGAACTLLLRPRPAGAQTQLLRLGGPILDKYSDPGQWASLLKECWISKSFWRRQAGFRTIP
jgi:hypothetical protein